MAKNCWKHLIWTQNSQKKGDPFFLIRAWCHNKKCTECSNLLKYAKLAKTNEAISRKWQKTAKNPYFGDKMVNNLDTHFFFQKSGFVTFLHLEQANLLQKIRKTNGGKYENFCLTDRLTGWETDWLTELNLKNQSVGLKGGWKKIKKLGELLMKGV